jgi:hypothetical protein
VGSAVSRWATLGGTQWATLGRKGTAAWAREESKRRRRLRVNRLRARRGRWSSVTPRRDAGRSDLRRGGRNRGDRSPRAARRDTGGRAAIGSPCVHEAAQGMARRPLSACHPSVTHASTDGAPTVGWSLSRERMSAGLRSSRSRARRPPAIGSLLDRCGSPGGAIEAGGGGPVTQLGHEVPSGGTERVLTRLYVGGWRDPFMTHALETGVLKGSNGPSGGSFRASPEGLTGQLTCGLAWSG